LPLIVNPVTVLKLTLILFPRASFKVNVLAEYVAPVIYGNVLIIFNVLPDVNALIPVNPVADVIILPRYVVADIVFAVNPLILAVFADIVFAVNPLILAVLADKLPLTVNPVNILKLTLNVFPETSLNVKVFAEYVAPVIYCDVLIMLIVLTEVNAEIPVNPVTEVITLPKYVVADIVFAVNPLMLAVVAVNPLRIFTFPLNLESAVTVKPEIVIFEKLSKV
jgi:hypothetical protein